MFTRRFCFLVLAACVSLLISSSARAQYKLETCEDLKIAEAHLGINTIETATCVNPTKTFSPKGTLRNVNVVYSFPKVPTGAGVTFMITKENADGEYVENKDYMVSPQHTTAYARFTINTPGKIFRAAGELLQQGASVGHRGFHGRRRHGWTTFGWQHRGGRRQGLDLQERR